MDLAKEGETKVGNMTVAVVDPVTDYAELMQSLFDFDAIRALGRSGFTMKFDAMGAITGPYATLILEGIRALRRNGDERNAAPDFGGHHPDPNLVHAKDLVDLVMPPGGPTSAQPRWRWRPQPDHWPRHVCDAIGLPRHPRRQCKAHPRLCQWHRRHRPFHADECGGGTVWRRNSVSSCYETPTGWKFFGNLLDAGKATICGEESSAPAPTTSARRTDCGPF